MQFSSMKFYTLTTVAVFYNLSPFVTQLFGAILLNEAVSCKDFVLVLITFISVLLLIFGMKKDTGEKLSSVDFAKTDHFSLAAFFCLIGTPVFVAI